MKHQLPVFLHTAFVRLSKFVLGCVLWVALSISLYECLGWVATQHYPQDGAVSPLFLVPVHTQAGGLAFRHPNQIRPGEKPQNPPQETGAYFVKTIVPDTFEATAENGMGGRNKGRGLFCGSALFVRAGVVGRQENQTESSEEKMNT